MRENGARPNKKLLLEYTYYLCWFSAAQSHLKFKSPEITGIKHSIQIMSSLNLPIQEILMFLHLVIKSGTKTKRVGPEILHTEKNSKT